MEKGIDEAQETRYYRDRGEAMKRFIRRFRHEISTPLSGAALHLEVATRRLQKDGGDHGAALENLRVCQQAVENASQMLDWIGDFSRAADEPPRWHALAPLVRRAAEPFRDDLARRGLGLELPSEDGAARAFGSAPEIGDVVSELTANAFQHATGSGTVTWTIEGTPETAVLACTSPGELAPGDPEHLFGAAKGPASAGRGFGLLRARRLAQSNGANLTLESAGGKVVAKIDFVGGTA